MRQLKQISVLLAVAAAAAWANQPVPRELEGVGVDEHVGSPVDLDLTFMQENGYPAPLRTFFQKDKPVILNLVYYSCPMLCNLVLNSQTATLREIPWTPGNEYEVVTISIDPRETFDLASRKRQVYQTSFGRPAPGWHFLVDHEGHAKRLAEQMGFHYRYDESQGQFAHAAAIMILTPDGKISRYLYGIKFRTRDVRLGLTEAAAGRGMFSAEKLLLFCFRYDSSAHSYVLFAANFMRIGGGLCALALGLILWRLWRKDKLNIPMPEAV